MIFFTKDSTLSSLFLSCYRTLHLLYSAFTSCSQCYPPLRSLNQPQRYESIPPNILTLTTTYSSIIPDILLRCQSPSSSQGNCLTMSPCEAEDKANLLNESQIQNSNASIHLPIPTSLSNPLAQSSPPPTLSTHSLILSPFFLQLILYIKPKNLLCTTQNIL